MSSSEAVRWKKPPLWTKEALLAALRAHLGGRVSSAFLIGSYARDQAHRDSDIDLILVTDSTFPWPDRAIPFLDLFEVFGALDLIIYTPSEWAELSSSPTGFIEHARREWQQIV